MKALLCERYKPNVELLGVNDTEHCFKKSRATVYECVLFCHTVFNYPVVRAVEFLNRLFTSNLLNFSYSQISEIISF